MSTHRFAITLKNASQVEPERRDRSTVQAAVVRGCFGKVQGTSVLP
jgi:hypothetical protein